MPASRTAEARAAAAPAPSACRALRQPVRPPARPDFEQHFQRRRAAAQRRGARPRSAPAAPANPPGTARARLGMLAAVRPAPSRSSAAASWLAIRQRRTPLARPTPACVRLAKVMPQAPASQLRGEQLRRHRRLAVRRQLHALIARELLHPAQVAGQRVALDHRQRQRQVAAQQVPALRGDRRAAHGRGPVRVALGAGAAYQRVEQSPRCAWPRP